MKILIIGSTETVSTAISRQLANSGHDLYIINRGNTSHRIQSNIKLIQADINDEKTLSENIGSIEFDAVCEYIGFIQQNFERYFRLFGGRTKQFVYISSASAYNKLPSDYIITEGTSLANPFWEYSRNKIQCKEYLMKMYAVSDYESYRRQS